MKSYLLCLLFCLFSLSIHAQDLKPLPNNWVGNIFTDQTVTFETDRGPAPDTVFAKTAPDVVNIPETPNTAIFDSIWYHLGDSMAMTKHVKSGDDVFDYSVEKDAMSYFKVMYNDTSLFLMLKYIDLNHQFTNHGWEICWQTKDPLRYEPDYLAATDDTLRKKSYARYTALGGGKARVFAGALTQVDACDGAGSFTSNPIADSILTDTDRTKIFWHDNGNGVIRVMVPIHFDALAYLTDPATGDISNPNDYSPFDPNINDVINWDIKSIGDVNGAASHYWWDSPNDYAYAINYYGGRLKFTSEPVMGTDTTLMDLAVDGFTVNGFDKNISHYHCELPVGTIQTPDVSAIPRDRYASIEIIPASNVKGDSLERTTVVNVTAHDDTVSGRYAITFNVIDNDDATLSNLLIDGISVDGFDKAIYHYKVELSPGTSQEPPVTANKTDMNASYEISSATNLSGDSISRTTVINVTAEDKTTTLQYTITYTVLPYTDALLAGIDMDGATLAGFDPNILHYHLELPSETIEIPVISYTLSNDSASASLTGASDLTGDSIARTTVIDVTAEDGVTTSRYTLTFEVLPSTDAYLATINMDGTLLANFEPEMYHYHVDLPNATTEVPVITYELSNDSASASITGATELTGDSLSRTTIIRVTAEDGITSLHYSITFALLPGEDAGLSDLRLDGNSIDNFNPDVLHYHIQVDAETVFIPLVDYTTRDDGATAEIFEASSLTGDSISRTTIVKVTAEDQTTTREYTLTFSVSTSIAEVKNNIKVYMSRGILTIEGINEPAIDIFDLSGKIIKSAKNLKRINMQDVSSGIYFVRINGTSLVFKVYKAN